MVRRILIMGIALGMVAFQGAVADDLGGGSVQTAVMLAPPPHISIQQTTLAAGIGLSWGGGELLFEGERHPFSVKGLSIFDLGISKMVASGKVQNLDQLSDFAGHYVAVEAGVAMGPGVAAVTMRNQNGVVISLQSSLQGVQLTLGAKGFSIQLD